MLAIGALYWMAPSQVCSRVPVNRKPTVSIVMLGSAFSWMKNRNGRARVWEGQECGGLESKKKNISKEV